jgi:hypothetical protein
MGRYIYVFKKGTKYIEVKHKCIYHQYITNGLYISAKPTAKHLESYTICSAVRKQSAIF